MARFAVLLICLCFANPVRASSPEYIVPEYTGPAYASIIGGVRPVGLRLKATAMILCVQAGMGPNCLECLFGRPVLAMRFNKGPIVWEYFDLGVAVYLPMRLFGDPGTLKFNRLIGEMGP
jgi:hypothetical protein